MYNLLMQRLVLTVLLLFFAGIAYLGIHEETPHTPVWVVSEEATSSHIEVAQSAPIDDSGPYFPVVKVIDGDTITVLMNGKYVTVRLIGLDTPETVDPRKTVQCFGKEASNKAKEMLTGKNVRLEQDPTQDTYDKYGRLLAYVFLPDGTNFEEYMIAEGYGHEYTYRLPYKYQAEFKAAEKSAREQKKGLWADGVCENVP